MLNVRVLPSDTKPDQTCLVCVKRLAVAIAEVPADIFDIPGTHSHPREVEVTKWIPVCGFCRTELAREVHCATCGQQIDVVDAIENSSGTTVLCRPCNAHEEDESGAPPRCIYCGEPMPHMSNVGQGPVHGTCPCPFCKFIGGHTPDCRKAVDHRLD